MGFDFTEDLLGWADVDLAPVSLRNEGAADVIKLRLPAEFDSPRRLFLRMRTE